MRYDQARPLIQNGDVLLVRGRFLHSRVIQRWTKSVYSHVGVALRVTADGLTRLCTIEAREGRGVQVVPLRSQLQRGLHVDWFQVVDPSIDRDAVARWAIEKWDLQYASPRQLFRSFVTTPLFAWLGLPTRLDRDRWFCSWFSAEALRAGGWTPPSDDVVPPELASPGDVALFSCLRRRGPLTLED